MGHRADVGPRRVDREVDRQVGRRAAAAAATARRDPGDRARRRRGRRPRARPCAGRSASRAARSASSRTDRLPSPAEMSPRAPSRRPARDQRSDAPRVGIHRRIVRPPSCIAPGRATATPTIGPAMPHDPATPGRRPAAACPEPRLQGPALEPGHLGARRCGQLHGAAAARPGPDRVGPRDGHRRRRSRRCPDLVFGMVAGAIADRSDRKRMMFLADLGRAGLTALIPLSVALGGPTMAVILLVAAPMSILRSFFLAGYTASVPALVGRSQVGRANSVLRGDLLDRLHPRPGHRRRPRRDDRPGPDARHRRRLVRAVRARPALRPARPARPGRPAARAAA